MKTADRECYSIPVQGASLTNRKNSEFRRTHIAWTILPVLAALAVCAMPLTSLQAHSKEHGPPAACTLRVEFLTPTGETDFSPFITHLHESLKQNWMASMPGPVQKGERGLVVLRFTIQKDGTLLDSSPKIISSSQKKSLDKHALEALRKSAPFDPLPQSFPAPQIEVRASFYYNLTPPSR